ncbi:MAG: type II toxin-antitoxin system Phd/YefM family antitoxin [Acidimicrobiales bacterium]
MRCGAIGVREAKAELSRLLREVEEGAEWTITDRGRPVARLVPVMPGDLSSAEQLARLQRQGWIEPLAAEARSLPPPTPVAGDLAQGALQQDRDV